MIKEIIKFKNGNVAVLDDNGKQMPSYQKLLSDKRIKWRIEINEKISGMVEDVREGPISLKQFINRYIKRW